MRGKESCTEHHYADSLLTITNKKHKSLDRTMISRTAKQY